MQRGEYLLEDVVSVADVGVQCHADLLWLVSSLGIDGRMLTPEVHPVDGPSVAFRCTVFVGFASGQDEVLVAADVIGLASQPIEAAAVDALDKHVLVDGIGADAVVMLGHGIVADIGNI